MSAYYYTVAALPSLFFDGEPPISTDDLFRFLEGQLSERDFSRLDAAELEERSVRPIIHAARSADEGEPDESADSYSGASGERHDPAINELSDGPASPVAAAYRGFDRALRNALLTGRSEDNEKVSRYRRKGEVWFVTRAEESAREALSSDPLEAERLLDRARFDFLSELEAGYFFDFENIVVYYLKLQLITRRAARTDENGREAFKASYQNVLDRMGGIKNLIS